MRKWFWLWRQQADSQLSKRELPNKLPSQDDDIEENITDADVSIKVSEYEFPIRYEWKTIRQPEIGSYRIEENLFVSWGWYVLLTVSLVGSYLAVLGTRFLSGFRALLSGFTGFFFILVLLGCFLEIPEESPVEDLFVEGTNHKRFRSFNELGILLILTLLIVIFSEKWLRLAAFVTVIFSLVAFGLFHRRVVEFSFWWQSRIVPGLKRLPLIATNYVFGLVFGSLHPILFLFLYNQSIFPILFYQRVFLLFLGVAVLGMVKLLRRGTTSSWRSDADRFQRQGRNVEGWQAVIVTVVFVVSVSLGFGYVSYRFLSTAAVFLSNRPNISGYGLVVLSGIPVWYLASGLLYQVFGYFRGVIWLLIRSEMEDLNHIVEIDAETHVLDYDGIYAGAITLVNDHIVVSQGILDSLSDEQVAVVMAHEEGHLEKRDSLIGLVLTFLSPFVLTGKNVLYAVLDFRSREFRADQHAVSRINDRDQVFDTLDELQALKTKETSDSLQSVTPTVLILDSDEDDEPSLYERFFGFYFGEFAMTDTHPSLQERKDRL